MALVLSVRMDTSFSTAGATKRVDSRVRVYAQQQIPLESVQNVLTVLIQMVMESGPRAQPDARSAVIAAALRHALRASPGTIYPTRSV